MCARFVIKLVQAHASMTKLVSLKVVNCSQLCGAVVGW